MDTLLAAMPIIDVDTHYTEHPRLWTDLAPAALKARAPRVQSDANGNQFWVVEEDMQLGTVGYCVIRRDGSKALGTTTLTKLEEMHPGATDPQARLRVMDEQGISRQIMYPNILGFAGSFVMNIKDVPLRNFCVQAYNEHAARMQAETAGRLLPQALLPIWDMDLTVREVIRCHEDYGLTGLVLTDSPELWRLPTLSESYWDPLWSEAQARGLPINFHIGGGASIGNLWAGMDEPTAIAAMSSLADITNMRCLINLIFSGLLDRYPRLKFVSVESGMGWIPFLLELAQYQVGQNGVSGLRLTPLEYFQRQIYASYWFETDVAYAVQRLGPDNLMFETDFPHPACLYPSVQAQVQRSLGGLPEVVQRKILYETAARVYQLENAA
jgi:predicted TIM-barrel fold metal-dependent hydrolase